MRRPFTVTVAASGLGHVSRGVEAWADELAAALHARGVPVTLCKGGGRASRPFERVLPCWQRESPETRRLRRLLPRRVCWRLGLGSAYEIEQLTFARHLLRHLRRDRVDLLHVQDPLVALLVQRAARVGIVRTRTILAHGTEESFAFQKKIRYLQHLAPWHRDEARRAEIDRSTWASIPNFVDTDAFAPRTAPGLRAELGLPHDALVVLSVAAIKRTHKRVDQVIAEFARLRKIAPYLPAYLVVAGGWEPETDELVAEGTKRLGDRVRFLVRFPRSRMPELYGAADLFVLGSLFEMMPVAILEAAAAGLPIVVNRHPVLEWMTGPGGDAVNLTEPGSLTTAMHRFASNSDRRRRIGQHAREHCVRLFSRDVVVDQILDYYRTVLDDCGSTRAKSASSLLVNETIASARPAPVVRSSPVRVSVVIPTFNSGPLVVEAVQSVLAQTTPAHEILVIDDGSTDDTRRLATLGAPVRYIAQANGGVSSARNRGLAEATGDLVAFLDADDIWHPDKLRRQLDAFAERPDLALLGTATVRWPGEFPSDVGCRPATICDVPFDALVVRNHFATSTVLVRRNIAQNACGFDRSLSGPEDYDLWLRVARQAPVANLALPLTGYRDVAGSLSKQAYRMEAGMRRILDKLEKDGAFAGQPWLRRKAWSYYLYDWARMHHEAGQLGPALARIVGALAQYPLPFHDPDAPKAVRRGRQLLGILRSCVTGRRVEWYPRPVPAAETR